ncbi:MAG: pilus assembly protein [Gemmataceae bacterium]|nr:pilus assembly protein [Gemmataceae bacterium]
MVSQFRCASRDVRRGAASVELAVLMPLLMFLFVVAVDFAQVFYYSLSVNNCARNGALWASDTVAQGTSPYTSVQQAALADAANLRPAPAVSSATGTDASGAAYVEVTVTYTFRTITNYPAVPSPVNVTRTVRMRKAPTAPTFN